jgi:hypothetical protein
MQRLTMCDYREAKAMAQTLRRGLKAQSIDITHSNALELVAKALGFRDWQVLAARIEADLAETAPTQPSAPSSSTPSVLHCSFCTKSQYEVAKLIAGPDVFICDECVDLCVDIVTGEDPTGYVGRKFVLLKSPQERAAYAASIRERTSGFQRVAEAATSLLAEGGSA